MPNPPPALRPLGKASLRQPPLTAAPASILVVDDDPRMRRLARRMLSELGYRVSEAADASDAMRLLEQDTGIDLLFTDIVMPGDLDGRALGLWVRQHRPSLRVLLTSGYLDRGAPELSAGGETLPFLRKPYSLEELQQAVHRLLRL